MTEDRDMRKRMNKKETKMLMRSNIKVTVMCEGGRTEQLYKIKD